MWSTPAMRDLWPRRAPELLAVLPVGYETLHLLLARWYPNGDNAAIGARALGVLHGRWPLLGQPATSGVGTAYPANHPGPVESYLLAPFFALTGGHPAGQVLGSAVLVGTASVLTVASARRLRGIRFALAVAGLLAVFGALVGPALVTGFNPIPGMALLPVLAFHLLELRRGDARRWPVFLAAACVTLQLHLGFGPLVAVLLAAALPAAVRTVRAGGAGSRRLLLGLGLAVLLAVPVLVEIVVDDPSNPRRLLAFGAAGDVARVGLWAAIDIVSLALGPGPVDLVELVRNAPALLSLEPGAITPRIAGSLTPFALLTRPGLWFLALLGLAPLRRLLDRYVGQRHRPSAMTGLLGVVALVVVVSLSRVNSGDQGVLRLLYVLYFLPVLYLGVLSLAADRQAQRAQRGGTGARRRRSVPALAAALGAVSLALSVVVPFRTENLAHSDLVRPVAAAVVAAAEHGHCSAVRLHQSGESWVVENSAVYALAEAGVPWYADLTFAKDRDMARWSAANAPADACVVGVHTTPGTQTAPLADGERVVAAVRHGAVPFLPAGTITVTLRQGE